MIVLYSHLDILIFRFPNFLNNTLSLRYIKGLSLKYYLVTDIKRLNISTAESLNCNFSNSVTEGTFLSYSFIDVILLKYINLSYKSYYNFKLK